MAIISAGYLPSGIAFGSLSIALHVNMIYAIALSLLVYSGAVQSAFLGYWATGIDPFSMIITAFLLNLRHTFYGAHIESSKGIISLREIGSVGPLLTDEVYAIAVSYPSLSILNLNGIALYAYFNWFAGTAIGIIAASFAPSAVLGILFLALPALFLGLLVPRIRNRYGLATALTSGAVALFGRIFNLPPFFIIIPIILGVLAGILIGKLTGGVRS
ncbi:azaleucine resistance protein AzlC [Thermoplasmatales archaeon]|nr:azaleucine resistance protein AzlC [Thermoplasmatales archaeon]